MLCSVWTEEEEQKLKCEDKGEGTHYPKRLSTGNFTAEIDDYVSMHINI